MIPLFRVLMGDKAGDLVSEVLASGYIGEGEKVKEFNMLCSRLINNSYTVPTNSCTSAIEIALRLADIRPGDHVISTPMTCMATNTPILGLRANITWADVSPNTGEIDCKSVEEQLFLNRDIKAIVCVHWGGYPCDMERLWELAADRGIPVIEDAAHAWGSTIGTLPIGCQTDFSCFSFQAIKHLTTGDGGLIALGSKEDYERAKLMKWFGLDRDLSLDMRCAQDPPFVGFKMQMNDIAAAVGIANFDLSLRCLIQTKENAAFYTQELIGLKRVSVPAYDVGRKSSYWLYPVLVDDQEAFVSFLKEREIACSKVHERNDVKKIFANFKRRLPGVDYFNAHQINIPVGWWVGKADREKIVDVIREYDKHGNSDSSIA